MASTDDPTKANMTMVTVMVSSVGIVDWCGTPAPARKPGNQRITAKTADPVAGRGITVKLPAFLNNCHVKAGTELKVYKAAREKRPREAEPITVSKLAKKIGGAASSHKK